MPHVRWNGGRVGRLLVRLMVPTSTPSGDGGLGNLTPRWRTGPQPGRRHGLPAKPTYRQRPGEIQVAYLEERPTPLCSGLDAIELASPMLHAHPGLETRKHRLEAARRAPSAAVQHTAVTAMVPAPILGTFSAARTALRIINGAQGLCAD